MGKTSLHVGKSISGLELLSFGRLFINSITSYISGIFIVAIIYLMIQLFSNIFAGLEWTFPGKDTILGKY